MKAVTLKQFGGPEQLSLGDWPDPVPNAEEILVKVHATALNRADTLQRKGLYPPPPGESPILGLEMSGEVVATGEKVKNWQIGDRVCGLLGGGGYAALVKIHQDLAMPVPEGLDYHQAAAIPEVFLTAFQAINWLGKLQEGEVALIHAGASGVGTAAIQLVREMGGHSIVTASGGKHNLCRELGAEHAIDYRDVDFAEMAMEFTRNNGVDLVVDFIGAPYFERNLQILRPDGRLIVLAFMGGATGPPINLGTVLRKRLQIIGSTLRSRNLAYKISLARALREFAWDRFADGTLRPVIDRVYDWTDVAQAHTYMEENRNQGKIILAVSQL